MPENKRPAQPELKNNRLQSPTIERPRGTEPFSAKLPEIRDMVLLEDSELSELLQRFGVSGPWDELRNEAMDYAARMARTAQGLDPDTLDREVERLISGGDRRARLGLARETQRAFILNSYADEDPGQEYIRVSEDDDSVCGRCPEYAGIIGTLGQHAADPGLPGAATCDGGFYCRCSLVILD